MRSYFENLTEEQRNSLYSELNTNEEELRKSVKYLQEWMRQQPHLPEVKDEDFIKNSLIYNKNSIEVTKQRMELYLITKTLTPQVNANRAEFFEEFEKLFKLGNTLTPLPKLTPEGYRVWVYHSNKMPSDCKINPEKKVKAASIMTDISFKADSYKSTIMIIDFENSDIASFVEISAYMRSSYIGISNDDMKSLFSNRIHKIYVLNLSKTFRWILTIMQSFLTEKLAKRIVVWEKRPEDLVEELPKHVLPSIYGGTEKSLDELRDEAYSCFQQFRDWISECDSWLVDLTKIPENSKCKNWKNDLVESGLDGSFRSLNLE